MNARKLEKWLLLEQTGELSPSKQKRLNACPQAQTKREEISSLFSQIPAVEQDPSAWAVTRIHARLETEKRLLLLPIRIWQPVLALAACLMLAVTMFDFTSETSASAVASVEVGVVDVWNVQFEEDLAELENLILAMSGDPLDIMEM